MMCPVSTPVSHARLAMSRPSGLLVSRDTQVAFRPSRASPTAVFNSAPPTNRSRFVACSKRRKPGGLSRTMASPNVTTSWGMELLHLHRASAAELNQMIHLVAVLRRHALDVIVSVRDVAVLDGNLLGH